MALFIYYVFPLMNVSTPKIYMYVYLFYYNQIRLLGKGPISTGKMGYFQNRPYFFPAIGGSVCFTFFKLKIPLTKGLKLICVCFCPIYSNTISCK